MTVSDEHVFDYLDQWSSLSDDEIFALYSHTTSDIARRALKELGNAEDQSIKVSKENFVSLIRRLREAKRIGSRALGEAIIEASELIERNHPGQAIEVYRKFLASCPSSFFRRIAMDAIDEIGPPTAKP
jgi:hypothetical protein